MHNESPRKPYLIGLCGPDCVGKSTTARALRTAYTTLASTAVIQAFADPLYRTVAALVGTSVFDLKKNKHLLFGEWLHACPSGIRDKTPRWLLRYFGTELIRGNLGDSYWVELALSAASVAGTDYVIFEDARFPSEYTEMDCVVQLTRDGISYSNAHASDTEPGEEFVDIRVDLSAMPIQAAGAVIRTEIHRFLSQRATSTFRRDP